MQVGARMDVWSVGGGRKLPVDSVHKFVHTKGGGFNLVIPDITKVHRVFIETSCSDYSLLTTLGVLINLGGSNQYVANWKRVEWAFVSSSIVGTDSSKFSQFNILDNGTILIDGVVADIGSSKIIFPFTGPISVGGLYNGGTYALVGEIGRIGAFDENDTPICEYVPCKKDGVIGFFETVSETFVTRGASVYDAVGEEVKYEPIPKRP